MNLKNFVLVAAVSILTSLTVQAAPAGTATTVCPQFFLVNLINFDQHLQMEQQGMRGAFMDDYTAVTNALASDPNMVNCVDDIGDTPLTYVFNTTYNICTLPAAADYLISHGAKIDMPETSMGNTPLYYAVESYGYIFGTPDPIELSYNSVCSDQVSKEHFEGVIRGFIAQGANTHHAGYYEQSIPKIATELKVTHLLR